MTTQARFEQHFIPVPESGCWLWASSTSSDGYGRFALGGKARKAHRVAWQLYRGPIHDGLCALHKCDTPSCVNPDHLFLGTQTDNARDRKQKGRNGDIRGERNYRAKLTASEVIAIRDSTMRASAAAKQFGVHRSTVRDIRSGRLWKHINRNDQ